MRKFKTSTVYHLLLGLLNKDDGMVEACRMHWGDGYTYKILI